MSEVAPLSESKRRVLEKFLRGEFDQARGPENAIVPRPPGQMAPLSPAQEQLWARDQSAQGLPLFYNESVTVRRSGPLNVAALQRALTEIIRRHEIWRTSFEVVDGRPMQVVHSACPPPVPLIDLRGFDPAQREPEALRLGTEELQRPFDLRTGPLVRFKLFQLDDELYWLQVAAHQIVVDGVTVYQVFLPELVKLYEAFAKGERPTLPEPSVQFADFAHRQRQVKDSTLNAQLEYWRRQIAGSIPVLNWPADYPRPATQTFRGRIHPFALPRSVADIAHRLGQQHNVTLFATLMAAFAALLHGYTQQPEIILGTVVPAGRDRSEAQGLMGYLLNPVALRIAAADSDPFAELLKRTRQVILGALANDDVPFEEVVKAAGAGSDPSRSPLFQVAASLEPQVPSVSPGWDLTPMDFQSGGARWDLYFVWEDRPAGLTGRVQYNPDLFRPATITRMVEDFQVVLEAAAGNPHGRLSELFRALARP